MAKRKMKFHVQTRQKTDRPELLAADGYLVDGRAHCPHCGRADLTLVSHYFANPPGPFPSDQAEDRYLKLELRCNACLATFTEVSEKQYHHSTDLQGTRQGLGGDEIKHCPYCGAENLLLDSAAIHFSGDGQYSQKVFCVDCKRHHLEWSEYRFLTLESWDGVSHYQKLYDNIRKRQEALALQLHHRGQALHTSQAYRINQQLIDRIRETRLENPPQYDILPTRLQSG